jgi:hypothetical protein
MTPIRFFTDEDVYGHVAPRLRVEGIDALSTPEAQRIGASDPSQLAWAAQEGRVLFTFNVADFARLHHEWMTRGSHHAGVVVSQQRPLGDVIRRLLNLGWCLNADEMQDRLEYLSSWQPI